MTVAVAIFGFGFEHTVSAIISFMVLNFANSLLYPISSNALNELIPSEQRATILSVNSMIFSVVMIAIFPASGFLGDKFGLAKVFHVLGILLIFYMIRFIYVEKKNKISCLKK
ncbi:MAG: MFS transporter [Velocimicrobium sp.]